MNESQNSRHLLRALFASSYLLFTACDDGTMHASYASAGAARAAGAVGRGWLPEELPDSAYSILEWHELDTNTGEGSFSFGASDAEAFRAKLRPASSADLQRWRDPDKLQRDGYSLYVVPEFVLAVNWKTRHVHFVLVFERK